MNIRFEYIYRDAGNFKNWGEVVFANPNNLKPDVIDSIVENLLIEKLYFVADKVRVPDLHFEEHNPQLDHDWHEMQSFSLTEEAPNDLLSRDIEGFIESLKFTESA